MPLPSNSSITLQGQTAAVTSKPKIAMIVRMTEETLDALANLPSTIDFQFGDQPTIQVQDKIFPLRYNKEKDNQELFIRTSIAGRPGNPPLKLNANVIGKFSVEPGLSENLMQKLHNANAEAKKQKNERKTIMVATPPVITPASVGTKAGPKKKAPVRSTPKSTPIIVTKSYASPAPAAKQPKDTIPSEEVAHARQRMIHYLALAPATQANAVKEAGKDAGGVEGNQDFREKLKSLLNDVAEQEPVSRKAASASADIKWKLKTESWKEVRPYQYTGYTDNVRHSVARQARIWLATLRIPETDPAWDHVRFPSSGSSATAAGAAQRATNGTTTARTKMTKSAATKAKAQDIKARSEAVAHEPDHSRGTMERFQPPPESKPPSTRPDKSKQRESEKEEGELSASETPPLLTPAPIHRRSLTPIGRPAPLAATSHRLEPPGARNSGASTPTMPPPPSPRLPMGQPSSSMGPPQATRTGPVDARSAKRPPPEQSERGYALPPLLPPDRDRKPAVQVKKEVVTTTIKKERPAAATHRPSGSMTSINEVRDLDRREKIESDRESLRERVIKRKDRDESDRESLRAIKRERERASDLESLDGRERIREKKIRARDIEQRRRENERARETELPSNSRTLKEKELLARERERERERERLKASVKERPVAATATTTATKTSKKRKALGYGDSGDESSDWGYELERRASKKQASSAAKTINTKVKMERESPAPLRPSASSATLKAARKERERETSLQPLKTARKERESERDRDRERDSATPPPRKAKRASTPMAASSSKTTMPNASSTSNSKVHVRARERERERDRERERERESNVPVRPVKRERDYRDDEEHDYGREQDRDRDRKSTKRRRTSPIYTSSEEEDPEPVKPKKVKAETASKASASAAPADPRLRPSRPLPPPAPGSASSSSSSSVATPAAAPAAKPVIAASSKASKKAAQKPVRLEVSKEENPREYYRHKYPNYIGTMQHVVARKAMLERIARGEYDSAESDIDDDRASDDAEEGVYVDDGEDLVQRALEDYAQIHEPYKNLHFELESLQKKYAVRA